MRELLMIFLLASVVRGAIDTEDKRRSVVRIYPIPDGSITGVDKQHVAGFYRGISSSLPTVFAQTTIDRNVFPIDSRRFYRSRTERSFAFGNKIGQLLYWDVSLNAYTSTAGPVAEDRIAFWDNSGSVVAWLNVDGSLEIIGDEISVTHISPLVTKVADYTATTADYTVLLDGTGATVTITLPPAADNTGRVFCFKCINDDNTCDLDPNGTEEIDGDNANFELILDETIRIQSDGSNWWVL